MFGNTYRCVSSNLVHVCDRNCDQRVPYDRYSTICVVSKRLGPPVGGGLGRMDAGAGIPLAAAAARKRSSCGGGGGGGGGHHHRTDDDARAGRGCDAGGDASAFVHAQMTTVQPSHGGIIKRGRVSSDAYAATAAP